jgi:hypothetical protein
VAIVLTFSGAALGLAGVALRRRHVPWRPAVTLGLVALAAWWMLELYRVRWSFAIIAAECGLLLVLALRGLVRLEDPGATPRTSA